MAKAGSWSNSNLNLIELCVIFLLFSALLAYNYTSMQYNKLIVIPLVTIAFIYYLVSFDYKIGDGKSLSVIIISKLVYLFACIGFIGVAFEYVQNPGARIMILISIVSSVILLLTILMLKLIKSAPFEIGVIVRSCIFNLLFGLIYVIAYGLVI